MGLDAFLHYACPFRPRGEVTELVEMKRMVDMRDLMKRLEQRSLTFEVRTPNGPERRVIEWGEAERHAAAWDALAMTCLECPEGNRRTTPGCSARVDYPIDDLAIAVVYEALGVLRGDLARVGDGFVRSLVAAGNCDGRRWEGVLRSLGAQGSALGHEPVSIVLDGRPVAITPFMALEHVCFRPFLDGNEVSALRSFFRAFHTAVGDRLVASRDPQAASRELFASSRSLGDLAALAALVKQADESRLSLLMDG